MPFETVFETTLYKYIPSQASFSRRTDSGVGKSSLMHSTSFRIIPSHEYSKDSDGSLIVRERKETGIETCDVIVFRRRLEAKMAAENASGEPQTEMAVENDFAKYGEDITAAKDGGVLKIIKEEGHGKELPPIGSKVRVYYSGKLMNGEEFDSNFGKREPFEFEHGKGKVAFCYLHVKAKGS